MKKLMFSLSAVAMLASSSMISTTSAQAQSFVQLAPVTDVSTIVCSNFAKLPDGTWKALGAGAVHARHHQRHRARR